MRGEACRRDVHAPWGGGGDGGKVASSKAGVGTGLTVLSLGLGHDCLAGC